MIDVVGKEYCCGCSACVSVCPKSCILMKSNQEGFLYPVLNTENCIRCGLCDSVCPVLNAERLRISQRYDAFAGISKDSELLLNSSSGGIFSHLADEVLRAGGCVFGAAFDETFTLVRHVMIEKEEDLPALRGSKYLQSDQRECYKAAERQLKNGRFVLYTGTPCQIAGLRGFLRKEYENLLCVDVICHGSPSRSVWEKYLTYIKEKYTGSVRAVSFRNKDKSWKEYQLKIQGDGESCYNREFRKDPYMKTFLENYDFRESCYRCRIKESGPVSDITVGDFWGVENTEPELDSRMGVSLILIHTDKGAGYFERIKDQITVKETDRTRAISSNSAYNHSVRRPKERDDFYLYLEKRSWKYMENKYVKPRMVKKIKSIARKVKKLIKM